MPPSAPLSLFQWHVDAVRATKPSGKAVGEEKRSAYLLRLHLVEALVRVATVRLEGLRELEHLVTSTGSGSPLLGLPHVDAPLTSEEMKDVMSFNDFLAIMGNRTTNFEPGSEDQTIPRVLAQRIANALIAADEHRFHDRSIHNVVNTFREFFVWELLKVDPQGEADATIAMPTPDGFANFRPDWLRSAVSSLRKRRQREYHLRRTAELCSSCWTTESASSYLDQMHELEQEWLEKTRAFKLQFIRSSSSSGQPSPPGYSIFTLFAYLL